MDRESPPDTEFISLSFSGVSSNDFGDFGGVSSAGGVWHGDSAGSDRIWLRSFRKNRYGVDELCCNPSAWDCANPFVVGTIAFGYPGGVSK